MITLKQKSATVKENTVQLNCESRKKCKTADVFRFSNQGIWVAVAYDDDFFISTVFDLANFEVATVQFLNRGFQTT